MLDIYLYICIYIYICIHTRAYIYVSRKEVRVLQSTMNTHTRCVRFIFYYVFVVVIIIFVGGRGTVCRPF